MKMGKSIKGFMEMANKRKFALFAAIATYMTLGIPSYAFAATDPNEILPQVMSMITRGVQLLGGALIVWGAVKLGLAIKDQQGGNALSEAIATIAGGAVVVVAGTYFGTLTF